MFWADPGDGIGFLAEEQGGTYLPMLIMALTSIVLGFGTWAFWLIKAFFKVYSEYSAHQFRMFGSDRHTVCCVYQTIVFIAERPTTASE